MKIAVISGKGGSGKSSITSSWATICEKVVAIDCDVDASNLPLVLPHVLQDEEKFVSGSHLEIDDALCVRCGRCLENCAFGAIHRNPQGRFIANDFLCEGCRLCEHLCSTNAITLSDIARSTLCLSKIRQGWLCHGTLYPGDDNSGKMIAHLREIADKKMKEEGISLQLLDGPPGIGCPVQSTITGMDKVVIVTEPTLSGISDLERAYRVASLYVKDISILINKCDLHPENGMLIRQFCQSKSLPIIGEIPFTREMVDAQMMRQTIVENAPQSLCAREIRLAWHRLLHLT